MNVCRPSARVAATAGDHRDPQRELNTDADQLFVATARHETHGGLPTISYAVGSLENRETRAAVCATLGRGKRAFLHREKWYRLLWG